MVARSARRAGVGARVTEAATNAASGIQSPEFMSLAWTSFVDGSYATPQTWVVFVSVFRCGPNHVVSSASSSKTDTYSGGSRYGSSSPFFRSY